MWLRLRRDPNVEREKQKGKRERWKTIGKNKINKKQKNKQKNIV